MKKYFFKTATALVLVFFLSVSFFACQRNLTKEEKQIVKALNNIVKPLNGLSPLDEYPDIDVFNRFGDASVIGLGEATHGTKEFFELKHRLIKYFVENHGFRILGFEADMGETIYINRFITKGIGTIDEVMKKMHFWTWRTEEVKNLILWMKEYNKDKDATQWIHFIGTDCQIVTYNKQLIEEYLKTYDKSYPGYISRILAEVTEIDKNKEIPENISLDEVKIKCDSLKDYFKLNKQRLINGSGRFEYELIARLAEQTRQVINVNFDDYSRDYYMAENALWLTSLLEENYGVVLWAHNGHIAKNSDYLTRGSQGYFLSKKLRTNYKAIGFSFNHGSFQAVNYDFENNVASQLTNFTIQSMPLRSSYNYIYRWVKPGNFILIHADIPENSSLYQWYNRKKPFLLIGALYSSKQRDQFYYEHNNMDSFDAIIHIRETNNAKKYSFK